MKNSKINRIIITGGGTGGHLIPSFAIADALIKKAQNLEIRFIGSKNGIESKLYKSRNEKYYLINIQGIKRGLSFSNIIQNIFIFPSVCIIAIINVIKIYRNFKPDIVVGTGGYSSAIPLFIARFKNIKIIIQEQNAIPGLVNKLFLKKAYKVCFGFKPVETAENFINTGNPTLIFGKFDFQTDNSSDFSQLKSREKLKLNDTFTIFVLGGSQGSKPINSHVLQNISFYNKLDAMILWQCGKKDYNFIKSQELGENIQIFDFIKDIGKIYSKSNIVISRSGALTVSEITACGKASILIPFPHAANNHQYYNAKVLTNVGASILIPQIDLAYGTLEETLSMLILNPDKIKIMQKAALSIAKPNATNDIVNEINNLISV